MLRGGLSLGLPKLGQNEFGVHAGSLAFRVFVVVGEA